MRHLQTSEAFSRSAIKSGSMSMKNDLLFDERALLELDLQQQKREAYVKAKLNGLPIDEKDSISYTDSGYSTTKLLADIRSRIENLKRQIQEVRAEKKRLLANGVTQVHDYMEQLKREQEEHAREMKKLRDDDTEVSSYFIKEVERLKRQYREQKKPIDEIINHVKTTIAESDIAQGQNISSIHVTEIKDTSTISAPGEK